MEKNEVITLEDRGFIQVKGPEAKDFLQNIVTNNLEKVTEVIYKNGQVIHLKNCLLENCE